MKSILSRLAHTLLIALFIYPNPAIAAPSRFTSEYVQFYTKLKTTHDLAQVARLYKSKNPSVDLLINQIKSKPAKKLPRLRVRGHQLHFETAEGLHRLKHVSGTRFLIDDKPFDIAADFNQQFASTTSPFSLIAEAHAVAPLFWVAVIIVTAVVGSSVCFSSSVDNFFEEKEISAKWLRPGEFNRYMRKLKEKLKPICPGAAWADMPADYDYEKFFNSYCTELKKKKGSEPFSEHVASLFYGAADEADKALIQAATQDGDFMKQCLSTPNTTAVETQDNKEPLR